jgi:hypothetical protein
MHEPHLRQGHVEDGQAAHLFMVFHGVGSNAEDRRGRGKGLAEQHAKARVLSVQSPDACDFGRAGNGSRCAA